MLTIIAATQVVGVVKPAPACNCHLFVSDHSDYACCLCESATPGIITHGNVSHPCNCDCHK